MALVYGGRKAELDVKGCTRCKADSDDKKSQIGYVFFVNGRAVSWRSCK
jgi:hypothetical protein